MVLIILELPLGVALFLLRPMNYNGCMSLYLNKKYSWKDYQEDIAPIIDKVYLLYGISSLVTCFIQVLIKYKDTQALIINATFSAVLLGIYIFRNRIKTQFKVLFICTLTSVSIVTSALFRGLMGSGSLTLLALVLIVSIFYRPWVSIFIASLAIAGTALLMIFLSLGKIHYGVEVYERMNSLGLWVPTILALIAVIFICITSLNYLRSKMFTHLEDLYLSSQELLRHQAELKKLAHYDSLTGLPNRVNLFESLYKAETERTLGEGFMVIANIRQFRLANLLLGTEQADEILEQLGEIFSKVISTPHFVSRLVGDEFLFWVALEQRPDLLAFLRVLEESVKNELSADIAEGFSIEFSFSAAFHRSGDSLKSSFSHAGLAQGYAKKGQSYVCYFEGRMLQDMEQEVEILGKLNQAIMKKDFTMYYQMQVETKTLKTVGVESLVRWKNNGSMVSPGVFIPIITKHNLTLPFGYMTIEMVYQEIPQLFEKYGETITVSINISPILFLSNGFIDFMESMNSKYKINPDTVILEITEDVFAEDQSKIQIILKALREKGFLISLDDFGTGFSSLSYLSNIALDEVKIDQSFIQRITEDKKQLSVVLSICSIADAMGFKVVAEGIETKEQLGALKDIGCHCIQGFYFSRPEPLLIFPHQSAENVSSSSL